jgi:hypothetical protein
MFTASQGHSSKQFLSTVLLVLLAGLFFAPSAMSGKPQPGTCSGKYRNDPSCSPNPNPPPAGWASVFFDDTSEFFYENKRLYGGESGFCQSAASGNTTASGTYDCFDVGDIHVKATEVSMLFNNKYRTICTSYNQGTTLAVDSLTFGWTDDCADGSCGVEIQVSSSAPVIYTATGGAADRLDLVLNGTIEGSTEPNPFVNIADVDITSIDMVFWKPQSTRIAGLCTAYPVSGITFFSTPLSSQ